MKSGELIEIYKTRFRKLLKHYHNLLEDFGPNDIHHFRLEIKKLKAFLHLIYIDAEDHHSKTPKDLKLFYNLAGNIRNLQLHQKRIADLCDDLLFKMPANYLQNLGGEEKALKKQARQMAKRISIKDFENKLIEEVPGKLTKRMQNEFIQKNLVRFRELLALSFYTDEAVHEARKILKDVMYNFKYLEAGELVNVFSGFPALKTMNAITTALGDYHDLCIGLSLLNSTCVNEITDADEVHVLQELKIQMQVRKDVMRIEIIELLKRLEQSFSQKQTPAPLP